MASENGKPGRRGLTALSALIGQVIEPVTAKRGFAAVDLVGAWREIVGPAFADCTLPERIAWPREAGGEAGPGVVVLRVDGPRAIFVQHELPQIIERINAFFGYAAIGRARIVQGPVAARAPRAQVAPPPLSPADEATLGARLAPVGDEALRDALSRLGRAVIAARRE